MLNLLYFFQSYSNEVLWFCLLITNYALVLLAFRLWGKTGLYIAATISIILANIQALKQVNIFSLHASMGDISYVGIYLISDILSENYGKPTARKIIPLGIIAIVAITLIMYLSLKMHANIYDNAQAPLNAIFKFLPRLVLASVAAFTISQSYDIVAYQFWRKRYPAYKYIWIRNIFSTMVSQSFDNAIFSLVAFVGVFPLHYIIQIFLTSWLLRTIITVLDTPFVYWSVKIKPHVIEI